MPGPSNNDQNCPFCNAHEFKPTPQVLDLTEVLTRWQDEAPVVFDQSVWQKYTAPDNRQVTLFECGRCGFASFQPPLAGSPEFYAAVETENYYVADKWEMFEAIKDLKKHGARRVLDIGCGQGAFLDLLRKKLPSTEGAGHELAFDSAEKARSKGHEVYTVPLPSVLSAAGEKPFDAVCMFQVLEHAADPVGFLAEVRALLKPGGIIIIGVPDAAGPVRHFTNALTDIPPHHVTRWRESCFSLGAPKLGLKILRMAHEPLPDYLWEFYLPAMWDDHIWPARICSLLKGKDKQEGIR